ncbi:protein phosphatase 2C 51-like [Primulina huaijiensis]|uniref:protein phosphatase 2C 51-like n=1 Tax=Primulina huaijiensis TaxID=1492673 RepID=UPI003CC726BC
MIFDSVRHGSPVPESFSLGKNEITGGEDETMKDICRKRRELRRVKLLGRAKPAGDTVISPDCDVGFRNKRWKCADTGVLEALVGGTAKKDVTSGGASTLSGGFTCHTHGSVSVIGRRRAMEDAVAVELGFLTRGSKTYDFFGVFDGHGGFRVAQSCRETLHKLVAKIVEERGGTEIDWEKVMEAGFREMDEEVNKNGAAVAMVGSTAVVAVVGEEEVVVAHCGDSRAVISRGGVAVQLSNDHKPDRPDELERIVNCGGKVIDWNGQRVLGVLATSRSIGDKCLKPFVTPEPEVKVVDITDLDEFLILASDGLWDVVSNDLACRVVRKCLNGRIKRTSHVSVVQQDTELEQVDDKGKAENQVVVAAANVLVELAMARGSRDNVSVIVVDLRHSKSGRVRSFSDRRNQVTT